ncbi:hypothetical protein P4234_17070 [Pseudomonas aeruginosa]|nr:hypothetical protein [Pseudomonas aeruginosa]
MITQASGSTTAMAYLIAAIGVVFTALSYGRLVGVFPVAGSASPILADARARTSASWWAGPPCSVTSSSRC